MKFLIFRLLLLCIIITGVFSQLGGGMKEKADTDVDRRRKAFLASRKAASSTTKTGASTKNLKKSSKNPK